MLEKEYSDIQMMPVVETNVITDHHPLLLSSLPGYIISAPDADLLLPLISLRLKQGSGEED